MNVLDGSLPRKWEAARRPECPSSEGGDLTWLGFLAPAGTTRRTTATIHGHIGEPARRGVRGSLQKGPTHVASHQAVTDVRLWSDRGMIRDQRQELTPCIGNRDLTRLKTARWNCACSQAPVLYRGSGDPTGNYIVHIISVVTGTCWELFMLSVFFLSENGHDPAGLLTVSATVQRDRWSDDQSAVFGREQ
jgi:hypothetical protein